jgi:hypothetical protein
MTGDKHVLQLPNLPLVDGACRPVKMVCESQRIVRCVGTDSSGRWKDQLDTGLRQANAEIQSGSSFGRIDRPDDFDYRVIDHIGSFS